MSKPVPPVTPTVLSNTQVIDGIDEVTSGSAGFKITLTNALIRIVKGSVSLESVTYTGRRQLLENDEEKKSKNNKGKKVKNHENGPNPIESQDSVIVVYITTTSTNILVTTALLADAVTSGRYAHTYIHAHISYTHAYIDV